MADVKWIGGTHNLTDAGVWTPAAPGSGDVGSVTSGHVVAVDDTVGNYEINLLGTATTTTFDALGTTIDGMVGSFENFDPTLPGTPRNDGTVALTGANTNNGFLGSSGDYLAGSFPGSHIVLGDVASPDNTVIEQGVLTNSASGRMVFAEGGNSDITSPSADAVLVNDGSIVASAITVGVAIEGVGAITLQTSGRTLGSQSTFGAVGAGQTINVGSVLVLADPLNFRAQITDFANDANSSIRLAQTVTSALFENGVLYLENGSQLIAALSFSGVTASQIAVVASSSGTQILPVLGVYDPGNIMIAVAGTPPTVPAIALPTAVQYLPDDGPSQTVTIGAKVAANQTLDGYTVSLKGSASIPSLNVSGVTFGANFSVESDGVGSNVYSGLLNAVGANTNFGTIAAHTDGATMPVSGTGRLTVTLSDVVSPDGVLLVAGMLDNEGLIETDAGSSTSIGGGGDDALTNNGYITDYGAITIATTVSGAGTIIIGDLTSHAASVTFGVVGVASSVDAGQTIMFENGTVNVDDLSDFDAAITDFNSRDSLVLQDYMAASYTYADGVLDLTGAASGALRIEGEAGVGLNTGSFVVQQSGADTVITLAATCYCPATLILTDRGDVPVELLRIGDTVITASREHRPIHWIGRRSYAGRFLTANPAVHPILFRAGALGDGLPRRDLLVSPDHAMFIDGVLVPAKALLNGSTIVQERDLDRVDYYHVELDSHDVLLAEGAPSESFLHDGNRGQFHNSAEHPVLYPNAQATGERCAPRVDCGFALEAIRQRLAEISAQVPLAA